MEQDHQAVGCAGKRPIIMFALKFGALMLLYYALSMTPFSERVFWPVNLHANAQASNWVLQGLRQNTSVTGDTIHSKTFSFVIKRGCDATEPVWLLAAAVISFPAPLWRKLTGLVAGTVLLLGINLLRVVGLFFVGRDHPGLYGALHLTVFPAVFIVLAMIIWAGWVEWAVRRD
jgi:exosortase/archaeosortase family protein